MKVESIAKLCHEVNLAICKAIGEPHGSSWDTANAGVRCSLRSAIGEQINNPAKTPEESHNRWIERKVDGGWVHGPEKNEENKTHPNLTSYKNLPLAQQIKDHIFLAIVNTCQELPGNYEPVDDSDPVDDREQQTITPAETGQFPVDFLDDPTVPPEE